MATPVNFYADFKGLAALKKDAGNQDPKALREAARQFEGVFTQMMLKSMRQASLTGGNGDALMDSDQSNFYRDMFDNQMAVQLSKGRGLGLADMLVQQLNPAGAAKQALPKTGIPLHKEQAPSDPLPIAPTNKALALNTATKSGNAMSLHPTGLREPARSIDVTRQNVAAPIGQKTDATSVSSPESTSTSMQLQRFWETPNDVAAMSSVNSSNASMTGQTPTTPSSGEGSSVGDANKDNANVATGPSKANTNVTSKVVARPRPWAANAEEFVKQLWPHAQEAAKELGVDAKTLIAHAALETGWGKFVPCNADGTCTFNLFGIKANSQWKGAAAAVHTVEFEGGVAVKKQASFRAYQSPADSFRDYASFLKNSPRYASAVGSGDDAGAFATALQQGGYATDPNYANKLAATAARLNSMDSSMANSVANSTTRRAALKMASSLPLSSSRSVSVDGESS
jgi:flagellar protein FlgJ